MPDGAGDGRPRAPAGCGCETLAGAAERRERELLEPGLRRLYGAGTPSLSPRQRGQGRARPWRCTSGANGSRTCAMSAKCSNASPPPGSPSPCPARRGAQGAPGPGLRAAAQARPQGRRAGGNARRGARPGGAGGARAPLPRQGRRSSRSSGRRTRRVLLKAIAKRRRKLQRRALKQGRSLYGDADEEVRGQDRQLYTRAHRKAARRARSLS